jgi:hypothetical protein
LTRIASIRSEAAGSGPPTSGKWLVTFPTSPQVSEHRSARYSRAGYDPGALADCVVAMLKALSGTGETESIAPDRILTSRAAAQFGRYWRL